MSRCPKCGASVGEGDRFCHSCGNDLVEHPPVPDREPEEENRTISGEKTIIPENNRPGPGKGPLQILEPGTMFADRFEIRGLLGKGGMGVVYEAFDTLMNRTIALKVIRTDRVGGEQALQRLIAEGGTARDINHTNVIRVYDVGLHKGQPFIQMEKLQGRSMREWMDEYWRQSKDVPYDVATRVISEILLGLSAAHAKKIVHRDLKPENVFIVGSPTGEAADVKILDFGIANLEGQPRPTGGTGSSSTAGTIGYMAPEQESRADAATAAADIYSITVMFYELLMQNRPTANRTPPSGARPDVPKAIDALITAGLSDYPKARPQSAQEYFEKIASAGGTGGADWLKSIRNRYDDMNVNQSHFWAPIYQKLGYEWEKGEKYRWTKRNIIATVIWTIVIGTIYGLVQYAINGGGYYASNDEPKSNYVSRDYYEDDAEPEYTPRPTIDNTRNTRTTTTRSTDLSSLSGTWYSESNAPYRVVIDRNGNFYASGYEPAWGLQVEFEGTVTNNGVQFYVTAGADAATGSGTWDANKSHLSFSYNGTDGYGTGRFHVKHMH